jgi:hypothetical protein
LIQGRAFNYPRLCTFAQERWFYQMLSLLAELEKLNEPQNFVAKYFEPKPPQVGLRGDRYLWEELKIKSSTISIPNTANELEKLLHELFKELTGEAPQKGKFIFVERYDTGGMSSGMVCSDFWIDKGFSLIIQRYIDSDLG